MNRNIFKGFTVIFISCLFRASAFSQSLSDYVNPLIGTKGWIFHGRTTPFVCPPFGNTQWTACTRNSRIAVLNYKYKDHNLRGFRASHKPAMWMGDYGFVTLKPAIGDANAKLMDNKLRFSHKNETSTPYYYAVKAKTDGGQTITTQLTATDHSGFLRFEFPANTSPVIYIEAAQEAAGFITIDTISNRVEGYNTDRQSAHLGPPLPNFKGFFNIVFKEQISSFGTWEEGELHHGQTTEKGKHCGAWVKFKPNTRFVDVMVGTSFISAEQAADNLRREIPDTTVKLEEIKARTQTRWDENLGRIVVEGGSQKEMEIFYTAMYHSLLFPRQFSEYGRYYSAFDDTIHAGVSYNDYSLWDTYRAQHPLLHFIAAEHVGPMVQSLLQMYEQGGYMPKWPNPTYTGIMIGTHADAVVADAVVKGVKGFDLQLAYRACMKDAMVPSPGDSINRWADRAPFTNIEARAGLHWVKKLGYVPIDKTNESVSNTLEGAYDDYCVAQVARAANHLPEYELLLKRSQNYRNVFNPKTGRMAPRNSDGTWYKNPRKGFTEGGPWTYLFCVQHDIKGLIDLLGGNAVFEAKLDKNFRGLRYWHENEPGHHYTYLYDYIGKPWKTQKEVAHYRKKKYNNTPHGLTGDDDCGQMSAWYIFSSLGFYPVTPGSTEYAIGTPLFPKVTLYPNPDDKSIKLEIIANKVSPKNIYIQSIKLNGKEHNGSFLNHSDLINGGKLEFEMGDTRAR